MSKLANRRNIRRGTKYYPSFYGFGEWHVIGSKNSPVKNITTKNSKKKNPAVHSFQVIFFNGCLMFKQVARENLSIKIYLSSSSLRIPG